MLCAVSRLSLLTMAAHGSPFLNKSMIVFILLICYGSESHSHKAAEEAALAGARDCIPLIIGLCLMGFVIIVLLGSLIVCFCIRNKKKSECEYNMIDMEAVKAVNYRISKVSMPPEPRKLQLPKIQNDEYKRAMSVTANSTNFKEACRRRRASVPANMESLEEVPSYLEEGSKRVSLSYNCLTEPLDCTVRKSLKGLNIDKLYMPESGLSTKNVTRQSSIEKKQENMHKKYSIYDDESLLADDYYSRFGKIFFSMEYNFDARILTVVLIKAQHLTGSRIKGKNRYYVKLRLKKAAFQGSISATSLSGISDKPALKSEKLSSRNEFRSAIKGDFCNPIFEETFQFKNVNATVLADFVLQFVIKEETSKFLAKNRVIGYVDFILKNADLIQKHESINDISRDIMPIESSVNKGQAVLSLHYNRELSIISASILEIIAGSDPLSAVTVEMYTRSIDNIIHKKKTMLENNLRSSDVVEFPMENCFLNSVCLVVVIFARIRNCSKSIYGRFIVGPIRFTDGPGLTHWAEMSIGNQMCIRSHSII